MHCVSYVRHSRWSTKQEMPVLPNFILAPFKELCLQSCSFLTAACSVRSTKSTGLITFETALTTRSCHEMSAQWIASPQESYLNPPNVVLHFKLSKLQNCAASTLCYLSFLAQEMFWFFHWFVPFLVSCKFLLWQVRSLLYPA